MKRVWLALICSVFVHSISASAPALRIDGEEYLLAKNCAPLNDVAASFIESRSKHGSGPDIHSLADSWALRLSAFTVQDQTKCVDALSPDLKNILLIAASGRGNQALLAYWESSGNDLRDIRTAQDNLTSIAAKRGDIGLLTWLHDMQRSRVRRFDDISELASASLYPNPGKDDQTQSAYDWLLNNGYVYPKKISLLHGLLSRLISTDRAVSSRTSALMRHIQSEGHLKEIIEFDSKAINFPMIYSAFNLETINFVVNLGFDIKQPALVGGNRRVYLPSALFNHRLDPEASRRLLDLGLSVKGFDASGRSILGYFSVYGEINLDLLTRYLNRGADLNARSDEGEYFIHEIARLTDQQISSTKLVQLIQILIDHGVDLHTERQDFTYRSTANSARNLPIHTVLQNRPSENLKVWLKYYAKDLSIKHRKTGASLIAHALLPDRWPVFPQLDAVELLVAAGAPIRAVGESHFLSLIRTYRLEFQPSDLTRLIKLGADINAIDRKSKLSALAAVVNGAVNLHTSCSRSPSNPRPASFCVEEQNSNRTRLARDLILLGANPKLLHENGLSVIDMAHQISDQAMRQSMLSALAEKP